MPAAWRELALRTSDTWFLRANTVRRTYCVQLSRAQNYAQSYLCKNAKNAKNPVFSEIFAMTPRASAEDETWRRRLVSVSATPARGPTGKTNAPPILPDFARVTPSKRRVNFCRRLIFFIVCRRLFFSFFLQAARFTFLRQIWVFFLAWQKRKRKSELLGIFTTNPILG